MKMNDDFTFYQGFKSMALHRKLQRTLSKNGWILHELWMVEKMDFEEKTIE
jgi:hypothetical protein